MGNTLTYTADMPHSFAQVEIEGVSSRQLRKAGSIISGIIASTYEMSIGSQPPWQEVFCQTFDRCGIPTDDGKVYIYSKLLLEKFNENCLLKPHSIEILETLKKRNKDLILVSNVTGPTEVFYNQLQRLDIEKYFSTIIWSSEVGFRKPAPEIFEIAVNRSGADISQSLFIGDSEHADIQGAVNFGMDSILLIDHIKIPSRAKWVFNQSELLDFCKRQKQG